MSLTRVSNDSDHFPRTWQPVILYNQHHTRQNLPDLAHCCLLLMFPVPRDILLEETSQWGNHTGLVRYKRGQEVQHTYQPFDTLRILRVRHINDCPHFGRAWLQPLTADDHTHVHDGSILGLDLTEVELHSLLACSSTLRMILSCSCSSAAPNTWQVFFCWTSAALEIPKGILRKW